MKPETKMKFVVPPDFDSIEKTEVIVDTTEKDRWELLKRQRRRSLLKRQKKRAGLRSPWKWARPYCMQKKKKDSTKDILDLIKDGLQSMYDIVSSGLPANKRILLKEERFKEISESPDINTIVKMAAVELEKGLNLRSYYKNNYDSTNFSFLYCYGAFCASCGRIIAFTDHNWDYLRANIIPNENRGKKAASARLEKTGKHRKEYLDLLKKKNSKWFSDEQFSPNAVNKEFNKNCLDEYNNAKYAIKQGSHDKPQEYRDLAFKNKVKEAGLKKSYNRHTLLEWRDTAAKELRENEADTKDL